MAQTLHTPGPWTVTSVSADTGNISVGHKDQRIVIAEVTNAASFGDMLIGAMRRGGGGFQQNDCRTQFANADLIAAAPELLRSLKEISDMFMARPDMVRAMQPLRGFAENAVFDRAASAIAKAEGRS